MFRWGYANTKVLYCLNIQQTALSPINHFCCHIDSNFHWIKNWYSSEESCILCHLVSTEVIQTGVTCTLHGVDWLYLERNSEFKVSVLFKSKTQCPWPPWNRLDHCAPLTYTMSFNIVFLCHSTYILTILITVNYRNQSCIITNSCFIVSVKPMGANPYTDKPTTSTINCTKEIQYVKKGLKR